jgi:hypothetical protein
MATESGWPGEGHEHDSVAHLYMRGSEDLLPNFLKNCGLA